MLTFGVGENKADGRKYLAIKGDTVPNGSVGVYIDNLILLLTCNEKDCCYLFWMVGNTSTGKGKGHGLAVDKTLQDQKAKDPLKQWKADLLQHGLDLERLLITTHLSDVPARLQKAIGCTPEMGEQVRQYLASLKT